MNVSECQQQPTQSNNFQENHHQHIESNNECNNLQERRQQPKRERRLPKRYADNVELNLYSNSNCRSAHVKQEKEESEFIEQIQSEPIAALRTFDGISLAEIYEIDQASPSPTPCSPPSNAATTTTAFSLKPKIRFICEFCNKAFTKQSEFLKHVQIHRNCGLECAECLALFRNHQQLEQHQCQLQHQGFTEIEYCSFERSPSAVEPPTATTTTAAAAINIIVGQNGQIQSIDSTANDASNDSNNTTKDDDDSSQLPPVASEASPLAAASGGTTNESIITNLKFTCLKCYKEFDCHAAVRRHNKQTHTEERNYKCQECSATFKHKSNFDYHMAKHTNNKPFKCEHCVKAFAVNYELVMHMRTHTGEQPYNCDICGKPFRHRCNLIVHQRLHSGIKPYKCDICDANFNSSSHLKKHKEYHLSEAQKEADMRYKKEHIIKPKLVDAKEFFRIHYETADATEPPTSNGKQLIQIGKNAAQPPKPARAIQPEPPKQQPCQAIPKSPNDTKNALNNKLLPGKAAHKKQPAAAADDMGVDTVDAQLEAQPTTTNEFNLIYKCQCSICFRYFKQRSALTRHLRTHTGERPYNCAWCSKSFADPSNFKKHKMAHIRDELIGVGGSGDGDGGGDKKKGKATPVEDLDEQFENAQFVYANQPPQRKPTAVATTNDDTDCEIDDDILDDFTTSKGPLIIWPDFKSNELQPSTLSEIEANTQSLLKYGFLQQEQLNKELDKAAADAAIDNEQQHLQLLTISYHDDLD